MFLLKLLNASLLDVFEYDLGYLVLEIHLGLHVDFLDFRFIFGLGLILFAFALLALVAFQELLSLFLGQDGYTARGDLCVNYYATVLLASVHLVDCFLDLVHLRLKVDNRFSWRRVEVIRHLCLLLLGGILGDLNGEVLFQVRILWVEVFH